MARKTNKGSDGKIFIDLLGVIIFLVFLVFLLGGSDTELAKENKVAREKAVLPVPYDLEKKFDFILDEYEYRLRNSFWGTFSPTTRRGGKGPSSTNFKMGALQKFLFKRRFQKTQGEPLNYFDGEQDGVKVYVNHKGSIVSGSGWVQKWEIKCVREVNGKEYSSAREFYI